MKLRRQRMAADDGAYAILFAALVVVLLAISAVAVDFASVRTDKRENRSATDSAATAAAEFLNPNNAGGIDPVAACERAWEYLELSRSDLSEPSGACDPFADALASETAAEYCQDTPPAMVAAAAPSDDGSIAAPTDEGDTTVVIAWPLPYDSSDSDYSLNAGFLKPDISPGDAEQVFFSGVDGTDAGCDRIGIAIFDNEKFKLGAGVGFGGVGIQSHSVARLDPTGGPADVVAALNILEPEECGALVANGGSYILVGPLMDNGDPVGPGIMAVESSGRYTGGGSGNCSGSARVINPTTSGSGNLICASLIVIPRATPNICDGNGVIRSHALDPEGLAAKAYRVAAVPVQLRPRPEPEGLVYSWKPVTRLYGCTIPVVIDCVTAEAVPATNYIDELQNAFGGTGMPTPYTAGQPPYTDPFRSLAFDDARGGRITATGPTAPTTTLPCAIPTGNPFYVPAGNWYSTCSNLTIPNNATLILQGGRFVVEGTISVSGGGCLIVNTTATSCATSIVGSGPTVTTTPAPTHDAIVYLRQRGCGTACGFTQSDSMVMPQTFMYSASNPASLRLASGSGDRTLWTAPGAGATVSGRTQLENQCYRPPPVDAVDGNCLNSHFSRLVYWSEYASPSSGGVGPNRFTGQANINLIGVFFTPLGYFDFNGGTDYDAASAQFWADKLDANGGAKVLLAPEIKFAISSPSARVTLIR